MNNVVKIIIDKLGELDYKAFYIEKMKTHGDELYFTVNYRESDSCLQMENGKINSQITLSAVGKSIAVLDRARKKIGKLFPFFGVYKGNGFYVSIDSTDYAVNDYMTEYTVKIILNITEWRVTDY